MYSPKRKNTNIVPSQTVEINNKSYTLDILHSNTVLKEYLPDVQLQLDSYGQMWLYYEDDGLFKLLKNTPNRVAELWLFVYDEEDADDRVIFQSHKKRCRPPYIAVDTEGTFWAVKE